LLYKAYTDRGLVYSAKARHFNNMLHVRYVHLTKAKHIHKRQTHPFVRLLRKDYDHKGLVEKKKNSLVVIVKGLGAKTN
jgi:hypothetical protein